MGLSLFVSNIRSVNKQFAMRKGSPVRSGGRRMKKWWSFECEYWVELWLYRWSWRSLTDHAKTWFCCLNCWYRSWLWIEPAGLQSSLDSFCSIITPSFDKSFLGLSLSTRDFTFSQQVFGVSADAWLIIEDHFWGFLDKSVWWLNITVTREIKSIW